MMMSTADDNMAARIPPEVVCALMGLDPAIPASEHMLRINRVLNCAFQRERPCLPEWIRNPKKQSVDEAIRQIIEEVFDGDETKFNESVENELVPLVRWLSEAHGGFVKNLYLLAQACDPDLVLRMNSAELAQMFGQTRAAWSARMKRKVNGTLKSAGYKGYLIRGQKTASACEKYRECAKGNTNRRGKPTRTATMR